MGMAEIALAGRSLVKRFGHVEALAGASVAVAPGEIVAVVGDNGAGKSTLLNCLLGVVRPDAGAIVLGDQVLPAVTVQDAQQAGVAGLYQDLALAPHLSVVDNMFLGREVLHRGARGRLGVVARREMAERAGAALAALSIRLPSLWMPVAELSGGERQAVAVARAVTWARTAIVMDEPTAALGARQSDRVSELMRAVAARGVALLVVSHDLPRALDVSDRVVVLWRGRTVLDAPARDVSVPRLVASMVGYDDAAA